MSVQAVTFSEMMQSEMILGIVNRVQTPLSLFQKFFGRMSGDSRAATQSVNGRQAGWDIYDATRQLAGAKGPNSGPSRISKKVIGHQSATLMRSHESIVILDEDVFNSRPLGGQIGSQMLDLRGQGHIARQVEFLMQRYRNQREWMLSRMLRGGFNMAIRDDRYQLKNYNAAATNEIKINYQIPTTNQARMQLGTGVDILGDWSNASTDIAGQLYKINKAFTRIHGRALRHIWINSNTFNYLQNNTGLKAIAGTSMTVFESLSRRTVEISKEGIPDAGFDVQFRALPLFTFHVYDGVLSADGDVDGTSTSEMEDLIPDDYAIFLPEPSDWEGLVEGTEIIAENVLSSGRVAQGFANWATRVIDPPGYELKFLDNYLPVVYTPTCIGYGYVGA